MQRFKTIRLKTTMNIVIAGAGQVGTHLAKLLSNGEHNITLIDEDDEKLKPLQAFDLMTQKGSPIHIMNLKDANIKNTDLFIAVTPHETENITACILAKDLGAKETVARIDNNGYVLPENVERFKRFGVDSLIYPEMLAAKEIVQALRMPGIRQLHEFEVDKLLLVGIKLKADAPILNIPISMLDLHKKGMRILSINRNYETFIPSGSDEIQAGDIVLYITEKDNLSTLRQENGRPFFDVRNVMILGGSRIAIKTVQMSPDNMNIKIFEKDRERSIKLAEKVGNALIINADGGNIEDLKDEGIDKMDAFVALTDNSETNILSCVLAKRLGVKKTVAEIDNLDYFGLAENFGVGTIINKKQIAASHIYELTLKGKVSHVKCLTATDGQVMEFVTEAGAKITRKPLNEIKLPEGVNIGAIVRNGEVIIAQGWVTIKPEDKVILFCLSHNFKKIEKLFS